MKFALILGVVIITSCKQNQPDESFVESARDTLKMSDKRIAYTSGNQIQTGNTKPQELIDFAKTLIGTPYKYGSTDPSQGFDCSGFITYVFNHFNIAVPRSSIDFTNVGKEIKLEQAKPGDIILFTGTDSADRDVGHMGIVVAADNPQLQFIHSSSGKANGVTITPFNDYYSGRFVKVIRLFPQNEE